MGSVWLAEDAMLDRRVALKELVRQRDPRDHEAFRRRALREARALARLRHPAIVQVYDVIIDAGDPWIVMEYVPGRSLAEVIAAEKRVDERVAAQIGLRVAGALNAAHKAGVLHRDVKPHNILLSPDERVYLVDFGIASLTGADPMTEAHMMIGTVEYMAPERFAGKEAQPPGDLWSLGVTLFQALEGYSPFRPDEAMELPATIHAVVNGKVPDPVRAGALAPVLRRLLDRDPLRRMTLTELARALRDVLHPREPIPTFPEVSRPEPRPLIPPPAERASAILDAASFTDRLALITALIGSEAAADVVGLLPAALVGRALGHLSPSQVAALLDALGPAAQAAVIAETDSRTAAGVVSGMPVPEAAGVIAALPLEQAAAVLTYVPPRATAAILASGSDARAAALLAALSDSVRTQVLRHR